MLLRNESIYNIWGHVYTGEGRRHKGGKKEQGLGKFPYAPRINVTNKVQGKQKTLNHYKAYASKNSWFNTNT